METFPRTYSLVGLRFIARQALRNLLPNTMGVRQAADVQSFPFDDFVVSALLPTQGLRICTSYIQYPAMNAVLLDHDPLPESTAPSYNEHFLGTSVSQRVLISTI
jgi:hypothetical protein